MRRENFSCENQVIVLKLCRLQQGSLRTNTYYILLIIGILVDKCKIWISKLKMKKKFPHVFAPR